MCPTCGEKLDSGVPFVLGEPYIADECVQMLDECLHHEGKPFVRTAGKDCMTVRVRFSSMSLCASDTGVTPTGASFTVLESCWLIVVRFLIFTGLPS